MKKNLHIVSDGTIERHENTIYFVNALEKKPLPIDQINQISCHGSVSLTSQAIHYLMQKNIPVHFFNYYGFYDGTLYPRESLLAGELIIKQAEHYLDFQKRLLIAKKIIFGSIQNMLKTIDEYKIEGKKENFLNLIKEIEEKNSITELMNTEARARIEYYDCFNFILNDEFRYEKRTRNPPKNEINALISFGNALLYTSVITELYNTQLNPTISYLHEPFARRFSLALDLSEIFKPLIVDRLIFYVINKRIIQKQHFSEHLNGIMLNEQGKKIFLKYYEEKLQTTIKHRKLRRNVSYQRLIRLECYKLIKHLLGVKEYKPFIIWW